MPGETTAGTGLGKATGRAGERSEIPEAVAGAGEGEGVKEGIASSAACLGDAKPLLPLACVLIWVLLILHEGLKAGETGGGGLRRRGGGRGRGLGEHTEW